MDRKGVIPVIIIVGFLALILFAIVYYGSGLSGTITETIREKYSLMITNDNLEPIDDDTPAWVTLTLTPRSICAGENVDVAVESNLPYSICEVFANDKSIGEVSLGRTGGFTDSIPVSAVGTYYFKLACETGDATKQSNTAKLVVQDCDSGPESPTFNVGDVVGGESGSETLTGSGGLTEYIDLSGVTVGGNCFLGARVKTTWDYADEQSCMSIAGIQQGLEWVFQDSTGIVWTHADAFPQSHNKDFCPLVWDGKTRWKLSAFPFYDMPCDIDYSYQVEVYVCDCYD